MNDSSGRMKLSICIGTFNRARFIGETLESILGQVEPGCEVVVVDNASTDNTQQAVADYARRFDCLRYVRQDSNKGLDRNFDDAVKVARGDYCWLFSDDDVMKPGAIAAVLRAIKREYSAIVVNIEVANVTLSKILQRGWIQITKNREYGPGDLDQLFIDTAAALMYIGSVVFKREIWLARDRELYYGSLFIHVGVLLQDRLPGMGLVIAEPLVTYRSGNSHGFSESGIEVIFSKWPSVLELSSLSNAARSSVRGAEPWKSAAYLLMLRALDFYSTKEYRRWIGPRLSQVHERLVARIIAAIPGTFVNMIFVWLYRTRPDRGHILQLMRESRFYVLRDRTIAAVGP